MAKNSKKIDFFLDMLVDILYNFNKIKISFYLKVDLGGENYEKRRS